MLPTIFVTFSYYINKIKNISVTRLGKSTTLSPMFIKTKNNQVFIVHTNLYLKNYILVYII